MNNNIGDWGINPIPTATNSTNDYGASGDQPTPNLPSEEMGVVDGDVVDSSIEIEDESVVEPDENVSQSDDTDEVEEAPLPGVEDEEDYDSIFPPDQLSFRGTPTELLLALLSKSEERLDPKILDQQTKTPGTWHNLVMRAIIPNQNSLEELRIRDFLAAMSPEERLTLLPRLIDPETKKTLLRTSPITGRPIEAGQTKVLTGASALLAFESFDSGSESSSTQGSFRIPLYNSGITLDVIVPTGVDIQTLFINCNRIDNELGAAYGAHYFTYADQLYKEQIIKFLEPLIVNSSYNEWRKGDKIWSVIKLPDLNAILMSLVAACYRNGFDNFKSVCTNILEDESKNMCNHVEIITANLFDMIVTRFSVMPKSCIDFLVKARSSPRNQNNISEIAQYQKDLSLEGRKVTIGDTTFTMRIPSIAEHLNAGDEFISAIKNEISGDNTNGQYTAVGTRYMRVFLPWISSVTKTNAQGGSIHTTEEGVILRQLEIIDNNDGDVDIREELRRFIDEVQLTYVGWPAVKCPKCQHVVDTPSGMMTIDPFTTFFTLALLYSKIEM